MELYYIQVGWSPVLNFCLLTHKMSAPGQLLNNTFKKGPLKQALIVKID